MRFTLPSKLRIELEGVRDAIEAGKFHRAIAKVCAVLNDRHVPDVKLPRNPETLALQQRIATLEGELTQARAALTQATTPAATYRARRAVPKPAKRIVDPDAIREYIRTHPDCEVLGCRKPPCPEPHHLIGRKNYRKGDDVPSNLIRLCKPMHELYHSNGPRLWLATFGRHLTADTLGKVERAARVALEEDAA